VTATTMGMVAGQIGVRCGPYRLRIAPAGRRVPRPSEGVGIAFELILAALTYATCDSVPELDCTVRTVEFGNWAVLTVHRSTDAQSPVRTYPDALSGSGASTRNHRFR